MQSTALTPATFALLDRLAPAVDGVTARELRGEFDGEPSTRLNVLMRKGYAVVDPIDQRWSITHAGFERWIADVSAERASEVIRMWPRGCDCCACAGAPRQRRKR